MKVDSLLKKHTFSPSLIFLDRIWHSNLDLTDVWSSPKDMRHLCSETNSNLANGNFPAPLDHVTQYAWGYQLFSTVWVNDVRVIKIHFHPVHCEECGSSEIHWKWKPTLRSHITIFLSICFVYSFQNTMVPLIQNNTLFFFHPLTFQESLAKVSVLECTIFFAQESYIYFLPCFRCPGNSTQDIKHLVYF